MGGFAIGRKNDSVKASVISISTYMPSVVSASSMSPRELLISAVLRLTILSRNAVAHSTMRGGIATVMSFQVNAAIE